MSIWPSAAGGHGMHRNLAADTAALQLWLALADVFLAGAAILVTLSAALDWSSAPGACSVVPSYIAMCFVLFREFIGLFLLQRAHLVQEVLANNSSVWRAFRRLMVFSITVGVWAVFGWSFWMNYVGVVPPGSTICLFTSVRPGVIVGFASADCLLSVGLLMLFMEPLLRHIRGSSSSAVNNFHQGSPRQHGEGNASADSGTVQGRNKLKRVVYHNAMMSMLIVGLDLLALTTLTVTLSVDGGPAVELWGLWVISLEAGISLWLAHSLTSAWWPTPLKAAHAAMKHRHAKHGNAAPKALASPPKSGSGTAMLVSPRDLEEPLNPRHVASFSATGTTKTASSAPKSKAAAAAAAAAAAGEGTANQDTAVASSWREVTNGGGGFEDSVVSAAGEE